MIKKFSVANYKIFTKEISIDFSDVKDYDFSQNGIRNGLINTAMIYGKNGSGKSIFGLALFDITLHLVDKAKIPEQTQNYLPATSDDNSVASFSYTFVFDGKEVIYKYKKNKDANLTYEEMSYQGQVVFSCDFDKDHIEIKHGEYFEAPTLNFDVYNEENNHQTLSVLRYVKANSHQPADSLVNKIIDFVDHMLWFRSLTEGNSFIGFYSTPHMLAQDIIKQNKLQDFQQFLHYCELDYKLVPLDSPLLGGQIIGVEYGTKSLDFMQVASSGTRLLLLFYYWSLHFSEVSFMFLDEFNAYYHYSLSYKIASKLRDLTCQVLMSTHDTSLMESDVLRPDCYFIMANQTIASLSNLTQRELREVHNLEKLYRNYGFSVQ